jgi:chorismate mutase
MRPVTSKLDIAELRRKIDAVDQRILSALSERVRLVMEVGDYKRARNLPVYDPDRERSLFDRLCGLAEPPLDAGTVRRIFERIVDECRSIEQHHITPVADPPDPVPTPPEAS